MIKGVWQKMPLKIPESMGRGSLR